MHVLCAVERRRLIVEQLARGAAVRADLGQA